MATKSIYQVKIIENNNPSDLQMAVNAFLRECAFDITPRLPMTLGPIEYQVVNITDPNNKQRPTVKYSALITYTLIELMPQPKEKPQK